MKERVLIQGIVSEVSFPCKGKLVPTEDQPPIPEADQSAGILYVAPKKQYGPMSVKNLLPGQTWLASTGQGGRKAKECRPIKLVKKAPYEIEPPCPHADPEKEGCGGCLYQTVPYELQVQWKEQMVKDLLAPVAGISEAEWIPIRKSPEQVAYRNKVEFSFGDEVKDGPLTLGMHKRGAFHDIVSTPDCVLVHEDVRAIADETEAFFRESGLKQYSTYTSKGVLRHLVVRRSYADGGVLVNLVTTSEMDTHRELLEAWKARVLACPLKGYLAGILHTTNDSVADIVQADRLDVLYGEAQLTEKLLDLSFRIFPFSFFQTNTKGAEELYRIVREFAGDVSQMEVFDLYCGTGTIAQIMAAAGAKKVSGIEIVEEAVEAARENAAINHLDNCEFIAGDVLKEIEKLSGEPDLIILDPPRDGIHPKALPKLLKFAPKRFIYVSCKPTSLVRDLPFFVEAGYRIEKIQTCDMFPMTPHVETVCCLYHQKKDFISVPYEPKNDDYLKQHEKQLIK